MAGPENMNLRCSGKGGGKGGGLGGGGGEGGVPHALTVSTFEPLRTFLIFDI